MSNPLLTMQGLPPFSQIKPGDIEPAVDQVLQENRAAITALYTDVANFSWESVVAPIEEMEDRLNKLWSPVSHMNAVVNSDALREAYNKCLPKLSEYGTEVGQNADIFRAYKALADSPEFPDLSEAQQKVVTNALRDFHLSGVDLDTEKKQRYKSIRQELTRLTAKFEENILDATQGWIKHTENESLLAGLPKSAVAMARQAASQRKLAGWVFTLEFPSYYSVMSYADNRELREEVYRAYTTRASDQGPNAGQWDNSQLMEQILQLRHEQARLLGFDSYAHYSLATKMAKEPGQVLDFLHNLAQRSKPHAVSEFKQLCDFAREHFQAQTLAPWDVGYYSEKQRQHLFDFSQEELKPYFAAQNVLSGLFTIVNRIYGIRIAERSDVDTWHADVQFFDIFDEQNNLRGSFYLDLYARGKKRGGAWMDDCIGRRRTGPTLQLPVAYLVCNLTPPVDGEPAQFTHDEVVTLFHEFGHGLHHMLTQVDFIGVSGINGVAWDAVELPSQFMENWCWEQEALQLIARHFKTGEILPDPLYQKMMAAKNYQSSMQMVRQLEFSLFDFRLHLEFDANRGNQVQQVLDEVRNEVAVIIPPSWNRFQHGFSHIFAGGYAAGYYSYKWAEVLSADAFSLFEETGIFNADTGRKFRQCVLELGGSRDAMDLFKAFRGREPDIEPLLRHNGIITA